MHPLLAHGAVGLWILSLALEIASRANRAPEALMQGAYWSMLGGLAAAVLAAVTGFADFVDIRPDHPAKPTARRHRTLNAFVIVWYGLNLALRTHWPHWESVPRTSGWLLALSILGVSGIALTGYWGGVLIYDNGIGVGRHRRRTSASSATLQITTRNARRFLRPQFPGKAFVAIVEARRLADGAMLRAELDGVVLAIVRVAGEIHAVQEFCTHRFGPLSEGRCVERAIECPWHGSRFELRTGAVQGGPAKVDLKVYLVQVIEGWICIASPEG